MSAPLRRRVPRPPSIFVGREGELAWLADALERGSVAVVGGFAGIGKTALLAKFCERFTADEVVCVAAENTRALYEQVCSHWGVTAEPADSEGSIFAMIAELERRSAHLLVEDAHRFSTTGEVATLVTQFAQWSRGKSRLMVIGRTRIAAPEVAEQTLWLPPLRDADIAELLSRCALALVPKELADLVGQARGSPLEARRLAIGSRAPLPPQLSDLSPDALALVSTLSLVERLPAWAIPSPLAAALERLVALQLIDRESSVLSIGDATQAVHGADRAPSAELASTIARTLIRSDETDWRWQALVLARVAASDELVDACLSGVDDAFVGVIGAQRLFELIEAASSEPALRARLLCVVNAPWSKGLAWLAELPVPASAPLKLLYGHALFAANRGDKANQLFHEIAGSADVASRLDALIGLARGATGPALREISDRLAKLELPLVPDRLRRDVSLALAHHRAGDRQTAQRLARGVFASRHQLGRNRRVSSRDLYQVLIHSGLFSEARRLAEEESYSRAHSPRWVYYAAVVAVETCDDEQRRRSLAVLEHVALGSMRYQFLVAYLNERHAEHVDLARAISELREMWAVADAVQDALFLSDCRLYELELALYSAANPTGQALAQAEEHDQLRALVELRRTGRDLSVEARPEDGPWHAVLQAERLLAKGDAVEADALLETWAAEANRRGAALEEADLRVAQAHILLRSKGSHVSRARSLRDDLLAFAEARSLEEVRKLAIGLDALLGDVRPSEAQLRPLAQGRGLIARVARALLGEQQLTWTSDKETLVCAERRWGSESSSPFQLDAELFTVKAPDGDTLALGKHRLLFQIVQLLAQNAPKSVTKEHLARTVWSVKSYRPDRDDKRIQVAVARLRAIVAKEGFPLSISTTPTGYVLADEQPRG